MALKDKLGDAEYAELLALINPPSETSATIKAWLKGALKSWTTWFGAFLVAAPEVLPALLPHFEEILTPDSYKRVSQIIGIIVILLRVKTTSSLQQKGSA